MIATGGFTGTLRLFRKAYITEEDARFMGVEPGAGSDPLIGRLERIQRNDVENIPAYLVSAFLFALSGPSITLAAWLFGLVTVARLLHTLIYAGGWQPWRSIVFEVGNFTHVAIIVLLIRNLWFRA
jgi:glutathione S-transferase